MNTKKHISTLLDTALTAVTPVIWGTTYLVTTEWLPPGRPFTAALIRTLPAGLLLVAWTRHAIPRSHWLRIGVLSLLNIGFFQALLFIAAYRLPGGVAAVVGALSPLLVMLMAWCVDSDRPGIAAAGVAGLAVSGMALLFVSPGDRWDPLGLTAAVAGTVCIASGTFLSRRWRNRMPILAFTGWQLTLGGLALIPFAILLDPPLPALEMRHFAGYLYLALFGALLAYVLWFRGISRLSPVAVSSLGLLSPLTAIVFGWALLGQSLTPLQITAMGLVLGSVLALQWLISVSPGGRQTDEKNNP
ncbi:EamA family transporter [Pontiella agarivorans]|uniref:EamA family transporter n=1 Tax=Pontiella agarivorans TaxID=3038953 RepID=A0ABU5MZ89_9BACT|nr:EamA family transporter [Pontiella agarivorans]MDZ8119495.1 EamA family transporter [Pontiella agarivorans]